MTDEFWKEWLFMDAPGRDIEDGRLTRSAATLRMFGAWFVPAGYTGMLSSKPEEPYSYDLWVGSEPGKQWPLSNRPNEPRDSDVIMTSAAVCLLPSGFSKQQQTWNESILIARLRGYHHPAVTVLPESATVRPYVNGCSTRELIPPARPGDPTVQQLRIPPHTSEQAHHTHSTARIVRVAEGAGAAVIGMGRSQLLVPLRKGDVVVLDPFCPHHFETGPEWLEVWPLHVWSATHDESDHAMMRGTALMGQGKAGS